MIRAYFMTPEATASPKDLELLAWFETNKQKVYIALLAALVAVGGWFLFENLREKKEAEAGRALTALSGASQGVRAAGPSANDYLKVVSQYGGTIAAQQASFLAAGAYFDANEYEKARGQFDKYLQEYSDGPFAPAARLGVAASLESSGKTDEALNSYQAVVTRHPNDPVASQAKLATARLLETSGKTAEALKIYREFERMGMGSVWGNEAMRRRETVLRKHPELAITNAAAMSAPAPAPTPAVVPAAKK